MKRAIKPLAIHYLGMLFQRRWFRRIFPDELLVVALQNRALLRFWPDPGLLANSAMLAPDPVRYAVMGLAIHRILRENIPGSFAEVGVWRGDTSRRIHFFAPQRKLFLFDTFEGFPLESTEDPDVRFRDTSVDMVAATIGDMNNVVLRKGTFPETAEGLEHEQFAFAMLDLDKYKPTLDGMAFFYPRVARGGYIFVHDYNSPESDWAVSKAVNHYLADKPEKVCDIPDAWGSIFIRKV